jgi:dienelactone hydrolase
MTARCDSAIIVLHEIYGVNQHIKKVCEYYRIAGFDVICPNLLNLNQAFEYKDEQEAYQYFMRNIGFNSAAEQVKKLIKQLRPKYKHIFVLGFSIGATIAWLCSNFDNECDGIIGYYGSRIREYVNIEPKSKTLLIFASKEKSFDVTELVSTLNKKKNVNAYMLNGSHGFSDSFSRNYNDKAFSEAQKLVDDFLNNGGHYE